MEYLIRSTIPSVVLAPMEGVTDAPMRAFLTSLRGFDFCVSEFVRVSQTVLPKKSFIKAVPEFLTQCQTPSGTPVVTQILGGDPDRITQSALNAIAAGARAIDLNFGCPAPTVNRHDGGATLLKFPSRIYTIVKTLRDGLPKEISVSAKLRLGWDDPQAIDENALACQEAGVDWITVHARTKMQGYIPPAFWSHIGRVRKQLRIPVVANGDIWSVDDFDRVQAETGCIHFMLGRGALADPYLASKISQKLGKLGKSQNMPEKIPEFHEREHLNLCELAILFCRYADDYAENSLSTSGENSKRFAVGRLKQWLRYVFRKNPQEGFHLVKMASTRDEIFEILLNHCTHFLKSSGSNQLLRSFDLKEIVTHAS